ncbi:protein of unknown function [Streptomyces sp. KY75]|nr:protein of unknown function [Streptomyces sp. KY75]CAD5982052.1 protein of unknown function [Streptomyces sp. KY70]
MVPRHGGCACGESRGASAAAEMKRATGKPEKRGRAGSELEHYGINSCDSWNSNSEPGQRYGTHGRG